LNIASLAVLSTMTVLSHRENLLLDGTLYLARVSGEAFLRNISLRMQLTEDVYETPWECAKAVGGSTGLWKGNLIRGVRCIPPTLIDRAVEDWVQSFVTNISGTWQSFLSTSIGTTLSLSLVYPLDGYLIKLIYQLDFRRDYDACREQDLQGKGWVRYCTTVSKIYRGYLAACGRMIVYFTVYHLLYASLDYGSPSGTYRIEIFKRFLSALGADILSYPLDTINRIQVVENLRFRDAYRKCRKDRSSGFYHSYKWHFCISIGVMLISIGTERLRKMYINSRCN